MADDFSFWEVMFILETVLFSVLETSNVLLLFFSPDVLIEVFPPLLPFLISYVTEY